jgi:hypothetical protein
MVQMNPNDYSKQIREASAADKPGLLVGFCRAAIAERERGELELHQVGSRLVTLAGSIELPAASLDKTLIPSEKLLDKLHAVGGRLDMAGQGGTTPEADEELWQEFKTLVDKYADSLST